MIRLAYLGKGAYFCNRPSLKMALIQCKFNQGDDSWMGDGVLAETGLGRTYIATFLHRMMSCFPIFKKKNVLIH